MPIDIDRLMRFVPPSVRQELAPRDIAFYALSIGIGSDPCDACQLPFVDPLRGPVVMPTMVLVMAHPGFYLASPESGVDPKAVLHAEQAIELIGPIPAVGEVTSHTRITEVVDKGPGGPALILSETRISDAQGAVFAQLKRTTFIRGGGGFGGAAEAANPAPVRQAPDGPPDHVVDLPTRPEQALFYRLNGDLNPLHSDPDMARQAGFQRPILHGLCTMGVVCHALLRSLGNYQAESMRAVNLRFSKPVYPGETIRTEIWRDGSFRARAVERDVVVVDRGFAWFDGPTQH
ncbi:MAG: MaoC/PaaZ C-terminal domain-containing protein [Opitutaceae bacterium]|nr:MaoC/PaaZ C-terminal domain-containing protein [Opitutaceae bacterium]